MRMNYRAAIETEIEDLEALSPEQWDEWLTQDREYNLRKSYAGIDWPDRETMLTRLIEVPAIAGPVALLERFNAAIERSVEIAMNEEQQSPSERAMKLGALIERHIRSGSMVFTEERGIEFKGYLDPPVEVCQETEGDHSA